MRAVQLRGIRKWLPWLALGAAVTFGALVLASPRVLRRLLPDPAIAIEEVRKGRFVHEVKATGALKAVSATPILIPPDCEGPQRIAWLAVDGEAVKKGDPVVLFDPSQMQKTLKDGKADRATALNKIGKVTAESKRTDQSLELDLDVVRREMDEAESLASRDPEIFSRNEIIESKIERDLLGKRLQNASSKRDASERLGRADMALGEIERSKAEMRIRQAERGLGSLRVLAPHDGLIVFERSWRDEMLSLGDTVFPGQKIAEIPDLRAMEAKVYVLEADAGGLKTGLIAKVTIEGRPGAEYRATVSRVDALAKTRNWRVPTRYFETILSLEKTDPVMMKPGQGVRASILLEDLPDAISIPRSAVFEKDGKRMVHVARSGRFDPVEVTVGHHSLSHVLIEKGLAPGDRIALRDPSLAASQLSDSKTGEKQRANSGASASTAGNK